MSDEARDGQNIALILNYQVNCWYARSFKRTILYYQLSMPNNFHNTVNFKIALLLFSQGMLCYKAISSLAS